jgi:hypothetical protein
MRKEAVEAYAVFQLAGMWYVTKNSVRKVSLQVRVLTLDLPFAKQKFYPLYCELCKNCETP